MIDFHSHILPAIDDGSQDIITSLKMIEELSLNGIDTIILTPHFYPHKISLEKFLNNRETAFEKLISVTETKIKLILASETYLSDYIFNYDNISDLCVSEKYILTELPYSTDYLESTYNSVLRLINNFNVIPILAHIDRYPFLMKSSDNLHKFLDLGCLVQINISSLCNFFLRKKLLNYIENDYIHVIGTDFHRLPFDSKIYKKSLNIISKKIGEEYIQNFITNANNIIFPIN